MKVLKIFLIIILICGVVALAINIFSKNKNEVEESSEIKVSEVSNSEETIETVFVTVNNEKLEIKLEDNSSARDFVRLLENGKITINMDDYGGFEKVGNLGRSLSQNNENITTAPGDVILYQGNNITIYYGTNNWSFTRLGRIQNINSKELVEILGKESVEATFSLE